jgi:adenylate cyclase
MRHMSYPRRVGVVAVVEVVQGAHPMLLGVPRDGLEVGRGDGVGLSIEAPSVSKRHARFTWQGDTLLVEDLGSTNRVRRDGELLEGATQLADGDELLLGEVLLRVTITGEVQGRGVEEMTDTQRSLSPRAAEPVDIERRAAEILPIVESFLHARDFADLARRVATAVKNAIPGVARAAVLEIEEGSHRWRELGVLGATDAAFVSRSVVTDVLKRGVALHRIGAVGRATAPSLIGAGATAAMAAVIRSQASRTRVVYADGVSGDLLGWRHALELQLFASAAASAFDSIHAHRVATQERLRFEGLRRYFSPAVVEQLSLLSKPTEEALAPTRTVATVLFADLAGMTALLEKWHDRPDAVVSILDAWFELGTRAVFAQNGTLDKFVGDAIMAVFGAPFPLRDAPLRALRCAHEMQQSLAKLSVDTGENLSAAIGIDTGSVLACAPGSRRRREFTVLGDPVGVAARLQEQAGPATILLGPSTAAEVSSAYELTAGPELALPRRDSPFTSWRVVRPR